MKIEYYVVYGVGKPFDSPDAWKKMWDNFAKVLKKHKLEPMFFGGPLGTSEDRIYVMKGSVEDYQALMGDPDYNKADPIASGWRTHLVLVP